MKMEKYMNIRTVVPSALSSFLLFSIQTINPPKPFLTYRHSLYINNKKETQTSLSFPWITLLPN